MKSKHVAPLVLSTAIAGLFLTQLQPSSSFAQLQPAFSFVSRDPGVRDGAAAAGGPLAGLSSTQSAFFQAGAADFAEEEGVADGLGPRMNLDSCGGCHIQPALGGSSPHAQLGTPPFGNVPNPQAAFAGKHGGVDHAPSFIRADGPVREARFVKNPDGSADGGVHALFTITGRSGAGGCNLGQPDFATHLSNGNVIFRIPTPTFGAGLIEAIPDAAIAANQGSNLAQKLALGIGGKANFAVAGRTITGMTNNNGNDGTIARFGWKAQNKSLLLFAGEAYNVEMGITNEIFQTEREEQKDCQFATVPNDVTNTDTSVPTEVISAVEKFAHFMRLLDAPQPSTDTPGGSWSISRGRQTFSDVGCALCHTPSFTTGNSAIAALRYKPVNLFSDLLVHDMGDGLADGVTQGEAGPREFRTAPLWGVGQRIFFLHDGRTADLKRAIRAHASNGSEANGVIDNFNNLGERDKQDLLNFLRSL
ncbi:MAG TPA: di-heme oxidoredictase family protein [Burkholderiales bacterium]|nr:di-heme oxidoredictase family protein [Burkholderiales bacterium]